MTVRDTLISAAKEKTGGRIDVTVHTLISDLNIDSLSFMDLIMFVEDQQGIFLSNDDIGRILAAPSIGELISVFDSAERA